MRKKLGFYIVVGMGFGAIFGVFLGEAIENPVLGVALGALAGTFAGWFIAAAVRERSEQSSDGTVRDGPNTQE
jgi:uncharacterized membrane protein